MGGRGHGRGEESVILKLIRIPELVTIFRECSLLTDAQLRPGECALREKRWGDLSLIGDLPFSQSLGLW